MDSKQRAELRETLAKRERRVREGNQVGYGVHSHTLAEAVPALLDQLDRQEAEIAELKAALEVAKVELRAFRDQCCADSIEDQRAARGAVEEAMMEGYCGE